MNGFVQFIREYWLALSLLLLAAITLLSLTPLPQLPSVPGNDKTHHFIAYGALIFPLILKKPKYWFVVIIFFALWSGLIELIQPYANRYGEWLDMLANSGGLCFGATLAHIVNRFYPAHESLKNV